MIFANLEGPLTKSEEKIPKNLILSLTQSLYNA